MRIVRSKSFGRNLIISALSALAVIHAPMATASTTEGPFTVKSVIIGGSGAHIEVSPAPAACTSSWSGTQLVILKESPFYKELLAGVLFAKSQGKQLLVWHDPQGDGTCGFGNQKLVNTIQIKD